MILLDASSSFESFAQLLGVLLIFLFVLVITYFTTKWIAGYQKGHSYNKNLQIVETLKLTQNKYVQIVEAGDVYLVIAIGKDEVTLLTQLTKEQLKDTSFADEVQTPIVNGNFSEILNNLKEHLPKK